MSNERYEQLHPTGASRRKALGLAIAAGTLVAGMPVASTHATTSPESEIPFKDAGRRVAQAPFGGAVSKAIGQYNRVSPYIANSGLLHRGGLDEAQALGFRLVLDLRGADEKGVAAEAALATRLGIERIHLPVTTRVPSDELVARFADLVHDKSRYPILVHCVSSNRSGALWALYRASVGVDPRTAVQEGRAAGLESREKAVRTRLGIG